MSGERHCGEGLASAPNVVEHYFRHEYGRLVAILVRRLGLEHLDLIEDGAQGALLAALSEWVRSGVPEDPRAWLYQVARNRVLEVLRNERRRREILDALANDQEKDDEAMVPSFAGEVRDELLRMLFICCDDRIPYEARLVLALKTLCGFSAAEISSRLFVSEANVYKRLARARERLREVGIDTATPPLESLRSRLPSVHSVLYVLFNEGYLSTHAEQAIRAELCEEAIRLGRLLLRLFQTEPEVMGLVALMLLQHARSAARLDADGAIVLMDDQDRTLWNRAMIAEGLALVGKAMRHRRPGPYQIQAAIAATHARAARPQDTDWAQIDALYGALERQQPSPVVTLNRAVAVSKVSGPEAALAMVEPLGERLAGYFHFWGLKGALNLQLGRDAQAREAFDRAIALANTPAEAAHIRGHLDRLQNDHAASATR